MPFAMLVAESERGFYQQVLEVIGPLDQYARLPLTARLREIVDRFEPTTQDGLRSVQSEEHLIELALGFHLDVADPQGNRFPELRLQYRKRSNSAVVRATRQILGALPPARILVLTPLGYRITQRRHLEPKRFLGNGQPRLARYKPASVSNLSTFLELYVSMLG